MNKIILFSFFPRLNYKRYQQLLAAFFTLDQAWKANYNDLKKAGWNKDVAENFLEWKKDVNKERIKETLSKKGIKCITINDHDYPPLLRQIYDPPICLFVRGRLPNTQKSIAIVGSRKYSQYGKAVAEKITKTLSEKNICIISGLAIGIDSFAHATAIKANNTTIAVLGSGIDDEHIYPAAHKTLAHNIIHSGGAIISEYPPGTRPSRYTFPKRNRIIAGLAPATLVVEAAEKSGALTTAQCALDNGREVFAVPQNVTSPTSVGVNKLLAMGAHPAINSDSILCYYN